ncbi:MAG: hypothetical protein JST13_11100, partial [Bacteroidetes bacterium]|nr:hypothetical protein [Bacteroidota bacterium]
GQIQAFLNNQKDTIKSLQEVEFRVFSQWGDDGIIQYLVNKLDIPNKTFIEFGVENYKESNTRFLLINNNWSGLVIDGTKSNIDYIKHDVISWGFDIHATYSFITKDNINQLLKDFLDKGYNSKIGILSIDIDGNDYWIWDEINVVNPIIVIIEYNAIFGYDKAWTIPYKKDFYRLNVHKSYQYWGASLKALHHLGSKKGYSFIGCNSNGNNAYFVRNDKLGNLKSLTCKEGFMESKFREYADKNGERYGGWKRLDLIKGMPIFNIETNQMEEI